MSISFITGKPGGGKGLVSMSQIENEIVHGRRPVITNLAVRLQPWVNGDFDPMKGFQSYLLKKYGKDFGVLHRIFVLPDYETASFFLWRVAGVNGESRLVKADAVLSKSGKIVEFDTSIGAANGAVLYVVDEAWKFWSARNWMKTGEGLQFYNAQHRKFGDDLLIVTQNTKQIDPAVYRVAQDFWVCKNHSKMTVGVFRQPDVFSISIYDQPPTGQRLTPMSRKLFKLDKKGLAQSYDTSAGVGLSGGMMADLHAKKKGLPWWGLILVVLFLCFLGSKFHSVVGYGVAHMLFGTKENVPKVQSGKVLGKTAVQKSPFSLFGMASAGAPIASSQVAQKSNVVEMTGFIQLRPGCVQVLLSDGSIYQTGDGHLQYLSRRFCVVDGVTNKMRSILYESSKN